MSRFFFLLIGRAQERPGLRHPGEPGVLEVLGGVLLHHLRLLGLHHRRHAVEDQVPPADDRPRERG